MRQRDEAVEVNVPADLVPLWHRVKKSIAGGSHERFEHLVEYAEENPREVLEALQASADAKVEQLVLDRDPRQQELREKRSAAARKANETRQRVNAKEGRRVRQRT
jgi:hypothetical protein